jgi:predicted DNA-binding transcriptional regulator AlpA
MFNVARRGLYMANQMQLPETGFLRLYQIIGNPVADPPIPAVIPIGRSTWWLGVREGRYPKPFKLGPRITAWRVEDIRALIELTANEGKP